MRYLLSTITYIRKVIKNITYILLSFLSFQALSQEIEKGNAKVLLTKEFQVGLNFNTIGWGMAFDMAKQKNVNYKRTLGFVLTNIRHQKEMKIVGTSGSKGYYYGKINSFVALRLTVGGNYKLYKAKRESGVEIHFKWKLGPSFGLLKPVYLEIDKGFNGSLIHVPERYNPDIHFTGGIYSSSSWFKGLSESGIKTGVFAKTGFDFNFSTFRTGISGGELGIMADYYPFNEIEILHKQTEQKVFVSLYLQFNLGKKY